MNTPEKLSQEMEITEEKVLEEKIKTAIQEYEQHTGKFVKRIDPVRVATNGRMGSEVNSVRIFTTIHIKDMLDGLKLSLDEITEALMWRN